MIVTIDGPAGAGKSSAARGLAARLGYRFLDTGAMYRAVAWAATVRGVDLEDHRALAELASSLEIHVEERCVTVDGEDVTTTIRTPEITRATRHAASNAEVRRMLVELQRRVVDDENVVTEGRDQGTVVFPQAACKIFLTASPEERARRRHMQLRDKNATITFEEVLAEQHERDRLDAEREVGPLVQADDAELLLTDGMTPEQVVDALVAVVERRTNA